MNPHHLELFFFVAKHQGITEAVRKMPYGIQQPAVSGQILQLEKSLGVKLFQRRPFSLTPEGLELYEFIDPFFSQLDWMKSKLSGEESQHLRLAANASALTHHLPNVLQNLQKEIVGLRLTLKESTAAEVETALKKHEADVAISVVHARPDSGIKSIKLMELPLILLAPASCPIDKFKVISKSAKGGHLQEPLIALPKHEAISQVFQRGLEKEGLSWDPTMEVSEISVIENYVATGFGFGLAVDIPKIKRPATIKKITFPSHFPKLTLSILYTGDLKPIAKRFVEMTQEYANQMMTG